MIQRYEHQVRQKNYEYEYLLMKIKIQVIIIKYNKKWNKYGEMEEYSLTLTQKRIEDRKQYESSKSSNCASFIGIPTLMPGDDHQQRKLELEQWLNVLSDHTAV